MDGPTITIRLATLADIPALQKLIDDSVRGLSADYYSKSQIDAALIHIFGVDTQLIEDRTYFVAVCAGEVVGAGGWSKRATLFGGDQMKTAGQDALLNPLQDAARIRAFYVHPDWSRKGIARQLLQACEQSISAAGFKRIELIATLPGEPLYSALGYSRCEPVDLPASDQSLPAFRMEKHLTTA